MRACTDSTNFSYGGSIIKIVVKVKLHSHLEVQPNTLPLYIVQENVLPLLGLFACRQMGLVSFSKDVHQLSNTDDDLSHQIQTAYSNLFTDELQKLLYL